MPRYTRDQIRPGMRLEGGAYPVDDPRREHIKKGQFMMIDAQPSRRRVAPVSAPDLDFCKQAAVVVELAARLQTVRDQFEQMKRK